MVGDARCRPEPGPRGITGPSSPRTRYPGQASDVENAERIVEVYVYWGGPRPVFAEAAKLIDCLEYQSCEHDGWEASKTARLVSVIRAAIIRLIPGYEEAPWAI